MGLSEEEIGREGRGGGGHSCWDSPLSRSLLNKSLLYLHHRVTRRNPSVRGSKRHKSPRSNSDQAGTDATWCHALLHSHCAIRAIAVGIDVNPIELPGERDCELCDESA
jgi:hypothetical protein